MARWSKATLAIYSEIGTAANVTEVLRLAPNSANEKGDRRIRKSGEYPPYKQSTWLYEPDDSKVDLDDSSGFAAVRALVADIRHLSGELATLRPDYDTQIRWSGEISSQGNFIIEAELLVELGALGCHFLGTAYHEFDEDIVTGDGPTQPEQA